MQNGLPHTAQSFVVCAGEERDPVAEGQEALCMREMAGPLGACSGRLAEGPSPPRGAVIA